MSNDTPLFGWDLLYGSVAADVKANEDILVCLTHLALITHGFRCVGLGDSKNLDGNETKSETLPKGWNDGYKLRYVYQGKLYNLQGTKLDDGIMMNLVRVDERTVSMVQFNSRSVLKRAGTLEEMIPNNSAIVKMIRTDLIEKVTQSTKSKDGSSQTAPVEVARRTSSSMDVNYGIPARNPLMIDPLATGVGRHDLDPLAGIGGPRLGGFPGFGPGGGFGPLGPGGGGMLFQPPLGRMDPDRQGLPGGALPPGARFDPFRPPEADPTRAPHRRPAPDNDELPPPGFDDMFM